VEPELDHGSLFSGYIGDVQMNGQSCYRKGILAAWICSAWAARCNRNQTERHFLKENRMKTLVFAIATFIALAGVTMAQTAPEPTVTLTQAELQAIINAQITASAAQPALRKVQGAFAPPAPTAPPPAVDPAK
jgi:hypothetical protein